MNQKAISPKYRIIHRGDMEKPYAIQKRFWFFWHTLGYEEIWPCSFDSVIDAKLCLFKHLAKNGRKGVVEYV